MFCNTRVVHKQFYNRVAVHKHVLVRRGNYLVAGVFHLVCCHGGGCQDPQASRTCWGCSRTGTRSSYGNAHGSHSKPNEKGFVYIGAKAKVKAIIASRWLYKESNLLITVPINILSIKESATNHQCKPYSTIFYTRPYGSFTLKETDFRYGYGLGFLAYTEIGCRDLSQSMCNVNHFLQSAM